MDEDEITATTAQARGFLQDEIAHSGRVADPGAAVATMTNDDISSLRRKFPFLQDFSDSFIRSRPMESLLKIETTSMKIRELERTRDTDDKLSANKLSLAQVTTQVAAGVDNRWTILHPARYLPGAACSAAKQWLAAREVIGLTGHPPVGNYDMTAVGLGGFVTSKGWVELHNPSSSKLALKLFSINNCNARAGRNNHTETGDQNGDDINELGEFKLALRTLRTAASFVQPWNYSFQAIEGFMHQTQYCQAELAGLDKRAALLTQFVDYCLGQNADRWRDAEPFLSTGELKTSWNSFFGARPQAALSGKNKTAKKTNEKTGEKKKWIDICFPWNVGACLKAAGDCKSARGTPLRHVCNYAADRNRPEVVCGKDHTRISYHK
jgi:hypothetical protein